MLAGGVKPEVAAWIDALPPSDLGQVIVRDGFLSNEELDKLVAAVDVVPIALTNNGPSGIMGKALAAEVPVVTAGSEVRARELLATDGGELADELTRRQPWRGDRAGLPARPRPPPPQRRPPCHTARSSPINLLGVEPARTRPQVR